MTKNSMAVWGLLLALVMVAPGQVDAQAQIGLNAGVTFSTLGDETEIAISEVPIDLGTETGFFAGASLGLPLGGRLSINPGLYVVQKGMSFEGGFSEGSVELSYIEVPVTIGVEVTGGDGPFGVSLFAGPEIAFEIDCDGVGVLGFQPFEDCQTDDEVAEKSDRRSTDFGLVFGVDVSYGDFFVNAGLDVGLTSLGASRPGDEFRNSAWFVGAGVLIGG